MTADGPLKDLVHKPLKSDALTRLANDAAKSVADVAEATTDHRNTVSSRQGAEWGMGSLQKDFGVLSRGPLPVNSRSRRQILDNVVLLHNFRVSIGACPNQLRSTFSEGHIPLLVPSARLPIHQAMYGIESGLPAGEHALALMIEQVRREGGALGDL